MYVGYYSDVFDQTYCVLCAIIMGQISCCFFRCEVCVQSTSYYQVPNDDIAGLAASLVTHLTAGQCE